MMSVWVHVFGVRVFFAGLTAFFLSLLLGPFMIRWLRQLQLGQVVRQEGPAQHYAKAGTPTMGGGLILFIITLSSLLWMSWNNRYPWMVLVVMLAYGAIGWYDDFLKIMRKNTKGLRGKLKLFWQAVIALIVIIYLYYSASTPDQITFFVPFGSHALFAFGGLFIVLAFFTLVGSSNAVNLTDGLDGLAIVPIILVAAALGILSCIVGDGSFSAAFHFPFISGAAELMVVVAAIVGAGLGFLWFNAYPAEVFMGDVGALGLGGALAMLAIILRQELLLLVMGGIFVIEAVSVILQVGSYRLRNKKRIFKMAPLHHHFELMGWKEPTVIVRFWILSCFFVLCGLACVVIR